MQKFVITFGKPGDDTQFLTPEVLRIAIRDMTGHTNFTVTEVPQPPFPTGMDTNISFDPYCTPNWRDQIGNPDYPDK